MVGDFIIDRYFNTSQKWFINFFIYLNFFIMFFFLDNSVKIFFVDQFWLSFVFDLVKMPSFYLAVAEYTSLEDPGALRGHNFPEKHIVAAAVLGEVCRPSAGASFS